MTTYGQLEYYCYVNDAGEYVVCCVTPAGEVGCAVLGPDFVDMADEEELTAAILLACAEALQELQDKGAI